AGLTPAAVICEVLKDDGTMARLPDLVEFSRTHGLKMGAITDLIHYRSQTERLVEKVGERAIKTAHGEFQLIVFREKLSDSTHLAHQNGLAQLRHRRADFARTGCGQDALARPSAQDAQHGRLRPRSGGVRGAAGKLTRSLFIFVVPAQAGTQCR